MKIYNRYKQTPVLSSLIPQKRGHRFTTRRIDIKTEEQIITYRRLGNNRYEIREILKQNSTFAPSATTIYNVCKRHGLNRQKQAEKQSRRKIIMSKIGELVHIDCHQLSKGITIDNSDKTFYLLGLIDGYSRVAWVEVLEDKKAITVMFAALKAFNILKKQFGIEIDAIMSDNGAEFGSEPYTKHKENHPFERLLMEMQMKHVYTKPYRPQTNGKIERFWKTLKEDFIEDVLYQDLDDLKEELLGFLAYYNEHRPHSAIGGKKPIQMINM